MLSIQRPTPCKMTQKIQAQSRSSTSKTASEIFNADFLIHNLRLQYLQLCQLLVAKKLSASRVSQELGIWAVPQELDLLRMYQTFRDNATYLHFGTWFPASWPSISQPFPALEVYIPRPVVASRKVVRYAIWGVQTRVDPWGKSEPVVSKDFKERVVEEDSDL